MTIYVKGQRLPQHAPLPREYAVYFIERPHLEADAKKLGLWEKLSLQWEESASNRFESHRNFDCIQLNIPDESTEVEAPPQHIGIYFNANLTLFIHNQNPIIQQFQQMLAGGANDEALPDKRVLFAFLNLLTGKDAAALESIEEEIAQLEDNIVDNSTEDYSTIISGLRKRLLKRKRYYESLFDAMVDLEENQNGFLTTAQLKYLHLVTNRADRLLRSVLNLRDYVTQVREAYQAQIDISLNKTMKLFTVITTIFLPLSLIAGWYGMNLYMPEYSYRYAYPVVIGLSILVVVGCLIYFKIKKWF